MAWLIALANDHGEPIHETTRDITDQVLDASRSEAFDANSTAQLCAAEDICLDEHGWTFKSATGKGLRDCKIMNGTYWCA
jgi:hypothetical protein